MSNYQCSFQKVNGQDCFVSVGENETYCLEHSFVKCMVCGKQASHECDKPGMIRCWANICESELCELLHLYISHPQLLTMISELEVRMNVEPIRILVGKINKPSDDVTEVMYKAGFLIPYENGGFIWTTLIVQKTLSDLEDVLNDKLKGTNEREVIYTEQFFKSKIPPGDLEELIG